MRIPILMFTAAALLTTLSTSLHAQSRPLPGSLDRCGTPDPTSEQIQECQTAIERFVSTPGLRPGGGEIPVVFHVFSCNGKGVVSDKWIEKQLDELNRAYRNTGFSFRLEAVEDIESCEGFRMGPGTEIEEQVKRTHAVAPSQTLNIYTCEPDRSLLGWSYLPVGLPEDSPMHGIVLHWRTLPGGGLAPFDLGRTAVHEAGHYLGLLHTFQNGCEEPGDDIDDTPYEAVPAFGCPEGRNTCDQPGNDPVTNFMDYSDDACVESFTLGQIERMQQVVAIYRPNLFGRAIARNDPPPAAATGLAASALARSASEPTRLGDIPDAAGLPWLEAVQSDPANGETRIEFAIAERAHVTLRILNRDGKQVDLVMSGLVGPGQHAISWTPRDLDAGLYQAELQVAGATPRQRTILIEPHGD